MYSVPAYPHKILYKFGDSTEVSIRLKGDEYNKWALTTDNYTLLPSGNEWYFAKADSMGNAVRSGYKLCADAERPESLRRFLAQQPKGLRPMVDEAQKKRLSYRNRAVEKRGRHAAVVGERRALVILMSFADVSFTKTEADFDALFNEPGYAVDGAQGSVYDYFREVSYGQLSFHCDVLGPYRAVYLGKNDMPIAKARKILGDDFIQGRVSYGLLWLERLWRFGREPVCFVSRSHGTCRAGNRLAGL